MLKHENLEWIDISVPLDRDVPVYPGDPAFSRRLKTRCEREGYEVARLELSSHCATHVDASRHFYAGGPTVDQIPLSVLCGPALVLDLATAPAVGRPALERRWPGPERPVERLLLKTTTAPAMAPVAEQAYLTEGAAALLRERRVRLVGIDALSVEGASDAARDFPVHRSLLRPEDPLVIVEGLALGAVSEGWYELLCLPLRVTAGDGAPARAALRRLG